MHRACDVVARSPACPETRTRLSASSFQVSAIPIASQWSYECCASEAAEQRKTKANRLPTAQALPCVVILQHSFGPVARAARTGTRTLCARSPSAPGAPRRRWQDACSRGFPSGRSASTPVCRGCRNAPCRGQSTPRQPLWLRSGEEARRHASRGQWLSTASRAGSPALKMKVWGLVPPPILTRFSCRAQMSVRICELIRRSAFPAAGAGIS